MNAPKADPFLKLRRRDADDFEKFVFVRMRLGLN